jgi:serine/threonine protein kinase
MKSSQRAASAGQTLIGWGESPPAQPTGSPLPAPPTWLVPLTQQATLVATSITRDDPHALIGKTVGGGYVITAIIGSGGMGHVYLASNPRLAGREMAVKVLQPAFAARKESVARFIGEARSAAALRSAHIVDILDAGQFENGTHYLLMKHANGGSLDRLIERDGAMPFELAFTIIVQIAAALHAAHHHPVAIIHRDVKPQNILLEDTPGQPVRAMLADFGVAKLNDGAELTSARAILGSPGYLAPETLSDNGARKADARVDVYSLASTFYEMVCGSRPYKDHTMYALIQSAIENKPFLKPEELRSPLPVGWNSAIIKGLAHKPAQRTASAKDFVMESIGLPSGLDIVRRVAPMLLADGPSHDQATLVYGAVPLKPPNQPTTHQATFSLHAKLLIFLLAVGAVLIGSAAAAYL